MAGGSLSFSQFEKKVKKDKDGKLGFSDLCKKYGNINSAGEYLKLELERQEPTVLLPELASAKEREILNYINFDLGLVSHTHNLNFEVSSRSLVHAILTGSATIAKVCVWAEKKLVGEVETTDGRKLLSGKADFLVGPPEEELASDVELKQILGTGSASLSLSSCVVIEIKREQDLHCGFVQIFAEMLVIANNTKIPVNGVLTDGNRYYFVRLEGSKLFHCKPLFREVRRTVSPRKPRQRESSHAQDKHVPPFIESNISAPLPAVKSKPKPIVIRLPPAPPSATLKPIPRPEEAKRKRAADEPSPAFSSPVRKRSNSLPPSPKPHN